MLFRSDFVDSGLMVALVDAPSDKDKLLPKFRISKNHANDMIAVVKYMNNVADVPVWVVGTSLGSLSAASVAIKKQKRIAGAILTSSVTRSDDEHKITKQFPDGVLGLNLGKLKKPVLVLVHQDDACSVSPPEDAEKIKASLSSSSRVEVISLKGGEPPKSKACQAMSQHGFLGVEREAVEKMAEFILK